MYRGTVPIKKILIKKKVPSPLLDTLPSTSCLRNQIFDSIQNNRIGGFLGGRRMGGYRGGAERWGAGVETHFQEIP